AFCRVFGLSSQLVNMPSPMIARRIVKVKIRKSSLPRLSFSIITSTFSFRLMCLCLERIRAVGYEMRRQKEWRSGMVTSSLLAWVSLGALGTVLSSFALLPYWLLGESSEILR